MKVATWVVEQDEIDDARALIAAEGFHNEDFEFTQRADPSSPVPSPVKGTVTATRKSNGVSRTYEAGHCSDWLARLEADLKSDVFTAE